MIQYRAVFSRKQAFEIAHEQLHLASWELAAGATVWAAHMVDDAAERLESMLEDLAMNGTWMMPLSASVPVT